MGFITQKFAATPTIVSGGGGLRATPPPNVTPPDSRYSPNVRLPGLSVRSAALSNLLDAKGASVAPTNNNSADVGAEGSDGNAGQIAGAAGNVNYALGAVAQWQVANPGMATIARIGLPVAGILLWTKGHHVLGGAAVLASVPLWMSKLGIGR